MVGQIIKLKIQYKNVTLDDSSLYCNKVFFWPIIFLLVCSFKISVYN